MFELKLFDAVRCVNGNFCAIAVVSKPGRAAQRSVPAGSGFGGFTVNSLCFMEIQLPASIWLLYRIRMANGRRNWS